jgi:hypothetical protein
MIRLFPRCCASVALIGESVAASPPHCASHAGGAVRSRLGARALARGCVISDPASNRAYGAGNKLSMAGRPLQVSSMAAVNAGHSAERTIRMRTPRPLPPTPPLPAPPSRGSLGPRLPGHHTAPAPTGLMYRGVYYTPSRKQAAIMKQRRNIRSSRTHWTSRQHGFFLLLSATTQPRAAFSLPPLSCSFL